MERTLWTGLEAQRKGAGGGGEAGPRGTGPRGAQKGDVEAEPGGVPTFALRCSGLSVREHFMIF